MRATLRRAFVNVAFLSGLVILAGVSNAGAQGGQAIVLFEQRCATCHTNATGENRAPSRDQLLGRTPESILEALTTGSMATAASMLSEPQKRTMAEYLAGRAFGTAASGQAAAMKNRCEGRPLGNPLAGAGWNGWGVDTANTRFQPAAAAGLSVADVPRLTLKWAFGFPEGRSAFGQPTVVGGRIYLGADTAFVYSLDAVRGCVYWSFQTQAAVRTAITIAPVKAGSSRFAAFFGDLKANVYAIDAENGTLLWRKRADSHVVARITGAPTFYNGRLYVPVSSTEEVVGGNPAYECCSFRGSVVAYDADTGEERWKTYTIAEAPKPTKKTSLGTQLWGPAGGAVWSAPTIDPQRRVIYVSTSNGYTYPAADTTNSVLALDLETGKRVWARQLTPNDAFVMGCGPKSTSETCPQELGPDFSVGSSPILRTLPDGRAILAVGQKSGLAWGLAPEDGTVRWQHRVGRGSVLGGIEWGGASDNELVYFPNADFLHGVNEAGGLAGIRLETGERVWFTRPSPACTDNTAACIPAQSAAASAIPGVVFSGATDGMIRAYDARDGRIIWEYQTARAFETVNGVPARGGSINGPGPTIVGGMLYTTSGYSLFGALPGNVLLAFGIH
jgi:polyvinyl alcohol dehydrogenase (cytochrome)